MRPAVREYGNWIVTTGDPRPQRVLERPWRGVVYGPTYDGPWVTREVDVVAVSPEHLCVQHDCDDGGVWLAWVPKASVTRVDPGGAPNASTPRACVTPAE
jgi:hypothetical protein